jgi:hypothetical protein
MVKGSASSVRPHERQASRPSPTTSRQSLPDSKNSSASLAECISKAAAVGSSALSQSSACPRVPKAKGRRRRSWERQRLGWAGRRWRRRGPPVQPVEPPLIGAACRCWRWSEGECTRCQGFCCRPRKRCLLGRGRRGSWTAGVASSWPASGRGVGSCRAGDSQQGHNATPLMSLQRSAKRCCAIS